MDGMICEVVIKDGVAYLTRSNGAQCHELVSEADYAALTLVIPALPDYPNAQIPRS